MKKNNENIFLQTAFFPYGIVFILFYLLNAIVVCVYAPITCLSNNFLVIVVDDAFFLFRIFFLIVAFQCFFLSTAKSINAGTYYGKISRIWPCGNLILIISLSCFLTFMISILKLFYLRIIIKYFLIFLILKTNLINFHLKIRVIFVVVEKGIN